LRGDNILTFFQQIFAVDFMAHVYCLRDPAIIMLHAASDSLIAISYFLIPFSLILLVRRRGDLAFRWAFILFGAFIPACGLTHVLSVVTLWVPMYRLEGVLKAITAFASMGTAILLVRLLPQAVALPGLAQFRQRLAERLSVESQMKRHNAELEVRVRDRTLQLESSRAQLAELVATLDKAQTLVQSLDGTILFWNTGSEMLYGWSREEALGRKSDELLETELPRPSAEIQDELLERGNWTGEYKQRRRDGSAIWVASYWALHCDADGVPVSVVKLTNDITALKHSSEALRISEAMARSLFENAGQGILTAGPDGRIVEVNAMVQGLFGYSREELVGASVDTLLPGSLLSPQVGYHDKFARQSYARHMGEGLDLQARRKDGSEFPVEISLSFVPAFQGGLSMAFISDTTARKQASRERESLITRLESALSEKTVLLKEVHHRVKNNLAVIAGLLGMQADALDDKRARAALEESQQRVFSMALIHEHLYATEHLDRVNFGHYIHQLSNELYVSYALASVQVEVQIEAEEIDLPVHRAVPCGLILNELLSNILKYAFPNGRRGSIWVRFGKLPSGELSLSCRDDGVGIPESVDWQHSKSVGLRIMNILAKQIDGELTLDRSLGGTLFELRFSAVSGKS
jgi:PAS domain S-box-containing protein